VPTLLSHVPTLLSHVPTLLSHVLTLFSSVDPRRECNMFAHVVEPAQISETILLFRVIINGMALSFMFIIESDSDRSSI
jgi:hypothetical protein